MYPTMEVVKEIAALGGYRRVPVCRELYSDRYTPVEVMRTLRKASRHCYLLESASLGDEELLAYRQLAEELGMDALVEAHDEKEVERALNAGAKIVGVNNRDLRTFQVDMANSIRLRNLAPEDVVFVSESGIRTSDDIDRLYRNRVDAVLIGETLMRSADKKAALEELNGGPVR